MKKIFYDFGANHGQNLPYYLLKADTVVAVEPNPVLAEKIKKKFELEISESRLYVEPVVLCEKQDTEEVIFWRHLREDVLSQFGKPRDAKIQNFEQLILPSRTPQSIVEQYGSPAYIKIDVEGYDDVILKQLFQSGYRPPQLSAEAHTSEVFETIAAEGYKGFKLVVGSLITRDCKDVSFADKHGVTQIKSFKSSSAGPIPEDVPGEWLTAKEMRAVISHRKTLWKDISACLDPQSL